MYLRFSKLLVLSIWALVTVQASAQSHGGESPKNPWTIVATKEDQAELARLEKTLALGVQRIEKFFGKPFEKPFAVEIHPSRAKFDEYFKKRWQLPKTEKWMV